MSLLKHIALRLAQTDRDFPSMPELGAVYACRASINSKGQIREYPTLFFKTTDQFLDYLDGIGVAEYARDDVISALRVHQSILLNDAETNDDCHYGFSLKNNTLARQTVVSSLREFWEYHKDSFE